MDQDQGNAIQKPRIFASSMRRFNLIWLWHASIPTDKTAIPPAAECTVGCIVECDTVLAVGNGSGSLTLKMLLPGTIIRANSSPIESAGHTGSPSTGGYPESGVLCHSARPKYDSKVQG